MSNLRHPNFRIMNLVITLVGCGLTYIVLLALNHFNPLRADIVHTIPANIANKATCDTSMPDVTDEINNWLSSLPDGVTAEFGVSRCYRVENIVRFFDMNNVVINGKNSKLQAFTDGCDSQDPNPGDDSNRFDFCRYKWPDWNRSPNPASQGNWPRNRYHVNVGGINNLVVRDLYIDGAHPSPGKNGIYDEDLEAQHGFNFSEKANNGVTLDNVHIDQVWGDFMYFGGDNAQNNITVKNSVLGDDNGVLSGNGRVAVGIISGTNIHFENNRIMNSRRSGVDLEPLRDTQTLKDIYFDNNYFANIRFNLFSNEGYGTANPVTENIYFRNNTIVNLGLTVNINTKALDPGANIPDPNNPATYRRKNFQFINNVANTIADAGNPAGRLISITGVDGVVISGNKTRVQVPRDGRSMVLVHAHNSRNVRITSNETLGSSNSNFFEGGFNQTSHTGRYNSNVSICESSNLVSNPLIVDWAHISSVCPATPPPFKPEDINQDGIVNLVDFSLLKAKFGQTSNVGRSDINQDGIVNLLDFSLLKSKFGQ